METRVYLYVVGAEPPQRLAGNDAEQQIVFVHSAAELELLKLTSAERNAGPGVPVELGQQVGDHVFLKVALDHHAVDAGPECAQVRGQRHAGGHELVQRHFPQTVHDRFRVVPRAVGRAVHLLGQVQRVRDRILHQRPAAERRARQQYRSAEQSWKRYVSQRLRSYGRRLRERFDLVASLVMSLDVRPNCVGLSVGFFVFGVLTSVYIGYFTDSTKTFRIYYSCVYVCLINRIDWHGLYEL